jgi:hypothetical protein
MHLEWLRSMIILGSKKDKFLKMQRAGANSLHPAVLSPPPTIQPTIPLTGEHKPFSQLSIIDPPNIQFP